ncbi:hypothetical protein [Sinomonas sp. ASV322]|uniref:hypothetical protein n=1 Tax=Sinomonas sp. ASV322 TaxID=3041920 RepID=UPI0027DB0FC7|nr:hypothetical protein [Sinomonas sp. ASV322]MDQ4500759.1 hypothetical protein [Sinomonas sp. ASV322]
MKTIATGEITRHVRAFLRAHDERTPPSRRRERSWDFCFNHFQDHSNPTEAMDLSCLHLGYYLASWGMLRGSSFLFNHTNALHYRKVVEVIEEHNQAMRGLDVHHYRDDAADEHLSKAWKDLEKALLPEGGRPLTLISKVMLGVWGCLPSYDTYFVDTFQSLAGDKVDKRAFALGNRRSRSLLAGFYTEHAQEIDDLASQLRTLDMATGKETRRPMTRAKVIDIFGFHWTYAGNASLLGTERASI